MFFSQIVWFFENSKNRKLQTLGASTFGDHTMRLLSILAFKWRNFTFSRLSNRACTKNTKNSVLKRSMRNYSTELSRKVEAFNTWTFLFLEFSKKPTIWLKNTKMGRIFSSVLTLKDFLSDSKITIHLLKIGSVKKAFCWHGISFDFESVYFISECQGHL